MTWSLARTIRTTRQLVSRLLTVGLLVTSVAVGSSSSVSAASAPTIGTATSNSSQTVDLSWTAPTSAEGLLGYEVVPQVGGVSQMGSKISLPTAARSATITGLTNGVSYTFVVRAIFPGGVQTSNPSNAVTPFGLPDAPSNVVATGTNTGLNVSWAPSGANGSAITNYSVSLSPADVLPQPVNGSTTSATFSGLTNGKSYVVTVSATNARGTTPSAGVSGKPVGPPDSPTGVSRTVGDGSVTISWVVPVETGGEDLSGFTIEMTGGASETIPVAGGSTSSYVKSGLTNGSTYTFTVSATNLAGLTSSASSPVTAVPAVAAAPALTSSGVTPNSGPTAGGQVVDLAGSNLSAVTSASVECAGGQAKAATLVGSPSPTKVSVRMPDCPAGVAKVFVTNSTGSSNKPNFFYFAPPTITSLSPAEGRALGGNSITIIGTGFVPAATVVRIGGKTALIEAINSTSITVSVPALLQADAVGAKDVQVIVNNSVGLTATSVGGYTYIAEQSNPIIIAPPALNLPSPTRVSGANRFATAARLSSENFAPGVEVAFVATGRSFADALSAGPVARGRGPVLLVENASVPDAISSELSRLQPRSIVILGGIAAVSTAVEVALGAYTSGSVTRLGGQNRYETAVEVSKSKFSSGVPVVYVATGANFADALAAGAAAKGLGPVLLTEKDALTSVTSDEVSRLKPSRVVVLGGSAVVSETVRSALSALVDSPVERLGGSDRYATAALLAADSYTSTGGTVFLATGAQYADALSAAPVGVPVLLVKPSCVPSAVATQLTRISPTRVVVLGGTSALGDAVASYVVCSS